MTPEPFSLLDPWHLLNVVFFISTAVYLPFAFRNASEKINVYFRYLLAIIILIHETTNPFFKITERGFDWWDAMPIHMCGFSSWCIAFYLITKYRPLFIFAFFWGLAGGGMSILTPDIVLGFPALEYLDTMWGHSLILMGVFTAIFQMNERPYLKDYFFLMIMTSFIFLPLVYLFNIYFGTNYWFVVEKPYGDNLMNFFPDPLPGKPYHLLGLIPAAYAITFLLYIPYLFKDKNAQ